MYLGMIGLLKFVIINYLYKLFNVACLLWLGSEVNFVLWLNLVTVGCLYVHPFNKLYDSVINFSVVTDGKPGFACSINFYNFENLDLKINKIVIL